MSPSDPHKKPLRQLAVEKLHGKGANSSQLGDPISLKAETSSQYDDKPKGTSRPHPVLEPPLSSGGTHEEKKLREGHHVRGMMTDEIRQGKASAPPESLEGDPVSLKAETTERDPVDHDNGPGVKGSRSKL